QNAPSRAAPDATLHHDASATTALGSAQPLHDHRVSLRFRDAPLGDALAEIAARARLHLIYSPDLIPADRRVSLTLEDVPALEAMRRVLAGQGIRMLTSRNAVVLVPGEEVERPAPARQGTGEIVGRVTDAATGAVISAVSIVVEGTNRGAWSDAGGRYPLAGGLGGQRRRRGGEWRGVERWWRRLRHRRRAGRQAARLRRQHLAGRARGAGSRRTARASGSVLFAAPPSERCGP